jgi:uncharacterized membrane protein YgcG
MLFYFVFIPMQLLYQLSKPHKFIILSGLAVVLSFQLGFAQDIPPRPVPIKFVNDFAGMLAPTEAQYLEEKLKKYADSTSTQIALVIIQTLHQIDRVAYAQKLATAWGIGQQGKDNGLLILVAYDDHKIRIQTGYGLEATLTDLLTSQIIDNQLIPNFKQKKYYQGLNEATDTIFKILSGEFKTSDIPQPKLTTQQTVDFFFYIIISAVGLGFGLGVGYNIVWLRKKSIRENPYLKPNAIIAAILLLPMLMAHIVLLYWHQAWEYYLWILFIYAILWLFFYLQSLANLKRSKNSYGGNTWGSSSSYSDSGSSYSDSSFGGGSFGGGGASGDW